MKLVKVCCGAFLVLVVGVTVTGVPASASEVTERWGLPCAGTTRIVRFFEKPKTRYSAGNRGIDFRYRGCESVRAPEKGEVSFSGAVAGRPVISVRVDERTVYSFDAVSSELKAGDRVERGQVLGNSLAQHRCPRGCVHFGVRVENEYVNPLRYFVTKPVLLPW